MVIHFPHRNIVKGSKGAQLAITSMVLALGLSMIDTVWSLYLDSIVHNAAFVGLISGGLAVLGVIALILSPPIIQKYPETKLWIITLIIATLCYGSFYFIDSLLMLIIVAVIITLVGVIRIQANGILVRDISNSDEIGKSEGLQYALRNTGWLVGPLLGGFIASKLGIKPIFLFMMVFAIIALFMFKKIGIKNINRYTEDDGTLNSSIKNLVHYFKDSERVKHYILTGGIYLYWGNIYLFMPLLLVEKGLPEYWIGILFFLIALPLVLMEYAAGQWADKLGFKRFFALGYLILGIGSLICFFISNAYIWIGILFLASFGGAMLEGNLESYFFKNNKREHEKKYYGPYNTSVFAIPGTGKLLASLVLFYFAKQYIFLVIVAEMFLMFVIALSLKEKITEKQ